MIVAGDRPTFWLAIVASSTPCVFLIVVGLLGGMWSAAADARLVAGASGLAGLAILLTFALRLCCVAEERRLISFTRFRPTSVPIADIETISGEPFGGGSRITARMRNGEVRTVIITPHPWWVSYSDHESRVSLAVEQLRQAIMTNA